MIYILINDAKVCLGYSNVQEKCLLSELHTAGVKHFKTCSDIALVPKPPYSRK